MLLISLFVVGFFTLSSAKSLSLESQWESFKQIHGKLYANTEEELYRKSIFEKNLIFIEKHNQEADKGIHTYRLGITSFADLNVDEIPRTSLNINPKPRIPKIIRKKTFKSKEELPKSVDWRTKGIVTSVKNQRQGPYCPYFAGVAAVEAAYAQKTGKHINLSEQNVIDCSSSRYQPESAVQWVYTYAKHEGIVLEHCYPYVAWSNKTCKVNETNCERYKIKDYYHTSFGDEEEMAAAVAEHVVTTELNVGNNYVGYYTGGILNPPDCNKGIHSVAVVGYGTENGIDYWIFKNSWGPNWGENGFGRILRGNHTCNIGKFGAEGVILE